VTVPTVVLAVHPVSPDPVLIHRAAALLRAGGLVAFPTETVYGLGVPATNAPAVARLFAAKGRPANNPLIVHLAHAQQAADVAANWPENAARLAERFWPGPLTLVLPRQPGLPHAVTAGGPTVAIRVPAHPVALALLEASGLPIAAPSANRSGYLSPTRAEHVLRGLEGWIDLLLDAGPVPGGLESTVLDLTVNPPRLLRPGLVTPQEIEAVIGPITLLSTRLPLEGLLPSPGLLKRHYSPRTPLECAEVAGRARVEELSRAGRKVGWLTLLPLREFLGGNVTTVVMPPEPREFAARLYGVLHDLDTRGLDFIVVDLPPNSPEWLAVRDRLQRAAARE
jgi:L-threonylcarbamoyladenylate synthase